MNNYLLYNTSCLGYVNSFKATFKTPSASPKIATEAAFVKHFNDKTVVLNNQIITGLLLLMTHGCKHRLETLSDSRVHSVTKSTDQSSSGFKLYTAAEEAD